MSPPQDGGLEPGQKAAAAFVVGKSVGNSVVRHRVVRRLRVATLPVLAGLPGGTQVVIRAMPEAAAASTATLHRDVSSAIARVAGGPPVVVPVAVATPSVPVAPTQVPPRRGLRRALWIVGWPLRSVLVGLVWVYRHTVSPILPPTCRYHPSCSAYGFEALTTHGAAKGTLLTGWRVLRCNPFSAGGLDPVPERGQWRPGINPDGTPRAQVAEPA